jgi:hypothetical protein
MPSLLLGFWNGFRINLAVIHADLDESKKFNKFQIFHYNNILKCREM